MSNKPEKNLVEREVSQLNKGDDQTPRVKFSEDGGGRRFTVACRTKASLTSFMGACGSKDQDFFNGLICQLGNIGSEGQQGDERGINFMLSVIKSIEPRDQVEAMLAAQMATTHVASMSSARRLAQSENILQRDSAERAFNKLTRSFAVQVDTLKRYRTGGEQTVTVQHVSVSEGGQAIVGNVTQASREAAPKAITSNPALTDAQTNPMPIVREPECEEVALRPTS